MGSSGRVMFSQVSVILSKGGRLSSMHHRSHDRGPHPGKRVLNIGWGGGGGNWADPPQRYMGDYEIQAGGKHPIGIVPC